ncbi:acetaldehyde dehydrogenase (acetylating) [Desulfosporosinus sp.]|uniref:acetaldehyde dehydrogenase (acetylating) n=1 Tax=Desulfosporosinus sp. TaxID=157907 RepID=UPI000E9D21E4|nr:acetaldehyde dehydrogenase (acetylating) [Desulfosporosinus sp.]MBC2722094.1 acetaldehyde dehydrogenase (acetylating) [Desulfosporosinus sp.]MBC2726426.1 acetaldehyde dehydrogenase (acetylating) [Desulfosporosinus sp.]HBV86812.1 acetaldehyde dehydrogenase (acetylating) [Desulfosporosinus sp.]
MENFDYDLLSVQETRNLARQAKLAQTQLAKFNCEQIDKIIRNMVKVAEENAVSLAKLAVEETGFGKVEDKIFKNRFASTELYEFIKPMQTIGVIKDDKVNKTMEIAEPVGLLMGIIPSTNPTSTAIYKSIIAIKARNGIVFSPHPSALKCTLQAAKLMNDAAVAAGAPANIIGCISKPSMAATNELMKCDEVAMIIATGGSAMVKAAYSAGKPALGVGPGNVPAYIEKTANISKAVKNIIASKTFDNGTICASEQSVIVEECIRDQVMEEFKRQGGYFMTPGETDQVSRKLFVRGHAMNAKMVGRSAAVIAEGAGITIPPGTKVLLGEQQGVGQEYPLSYEKLTTVLAFYTVKDWHEACELCIKLLNNGGVGHSLSIHTENQEMVMKFAEKPVFRILVNTASSQGGVGASTGLSPSFTLGCGTWGGSATSDNVTPMHLINIKRVAYGIKDVTENTTSSHSDCVAQNSSPSAISDDQIMNVVNEVIQLLKQRGGN